MKRSLGSVGRRCLNRSVRTALKLAPQPSRFALIRSMVQCDANPDPRLELKIAETQEELEGCFSLLHDAYVGSGYMKPDPSGLRVTIYHALPTTTTLCAKLDGRVVGTLSIVREGVFGFPLQSVFDLGSVRAQGGNIAEISALAIHRDFRKTGGSILFPLMKFMFEYCTRYFDTRHLVIAVHPERIEMYEALLMFRRLRARVVDRYDFANGAPAVGATLDLKLAPQMYAHRYGGRRPEKNLHRYFTQLRLPNIRLPKQPYFTTNHPVMTPELLEHFFARRTRVFDRLNERQRCLLRSIYDLADYDAVLPEVLPEVAQRVAIRRHDRFSLRCPAQLRPGPGERYALSVTRLFDDRFEAESNDPLPQGVRGQVVVQLGRTVRSVIEATRREEEASPSAPRYGFRIDHPDAAWRQCVEALRSVRTHADLALAA